MDGSDLAIEAGLADASVPLLLCSLVHMTDDPSWIRTRALPMMPATTRRASTRLARMLAVSTLAVACVGGTALPSRAAARHPFPLRAVTSIALPGHPTRFDYQSIDNTTRRLYVAHLGDSTVDVINLDRLKVEATIGSLADVHGVLAVPTLGRVYASATGTNQLATIDATTNKVSQRSDTGAFPDGLAYDPDHNLLLVSDKNDGAETLINAATGEHVTTIAVANEVGNVAYDARTHLAYVTARTPERLAIINVTNRKVVARIKLHGCRGAHGLYLDPTADEAYVACESNARLITVDLLNAPRSPAPPSVPPPTCSGTTPRCTASTSRPKAATSPSSTPPTRSPEPSGGDTSPTAPTP